MKRLLYLPLLTLSLVACSDDEVTLPASPGPGEDAAYVGRAVGNFSAAEWQPGKELFYSMGCTACHRPSWTTGEDNYWAPEIVRAQGELPRYPRQQIWPYSDMLEHRLFMKNDSRTGWCRTTPLWGRGLSKQNTGADDRLHDCRARTVVEAIMWHGYSRESDAYASTELFYRLPKADRDAVVALIEAI